MSHISRATELLLLWLLTLAPSVPLFLLIFGFMKVLDAKQFEVRTLLERGDTLRKYLSAYGARATVHARTEESQEQLARRIANRLFQLRYSLWEYFPAVVFYIFVNVVLVALALSFAGVDLGLPIPMTYLRGNAYLQDIVAGGVGALLWGIYELSERYRFGDLSPDVVYLSGAGVLFSGSVGAVVGAFVNDRLAWTVAFGLGVLGASFARSFVVEYAKKTLHLSAAPNFEATPSLSLLQGWNTELSQKLARAGVTSMQELACTNQFQLFLRSNLEWRVLLDLSDQALLILYIGDSVKRLYPLGIRSAVELAEFDWSEKDQEFFSGFSRDEAIRKIAETLEVDQLTARLLIRSISEDATVNFLGELWSETTPDEDDGDEDKEPPAAQGKNRIAASITHDPQGADLSQQSSN
jgi:hypothetical protein